MSIRLIALDLDGTTLNHEGKLPEANRAAFAEAFKKNAAVVVCTGRALQTVPKELLEVDEIRYLITSNGARIIDRKLGRDLYQSFLSPAAVRILPELIEKYGLKLEVFRDGQAHIEKSVFEDVKDGKTMQARRKYVMETRKPVENLSSYIKEHPDDIENVNVVFDDLDELERMRPLLESIPDARITQSFRNNLEIGGPDASKGKALEHLLEELGLSCSELLACGDALNDLPMIRLAGIGVAMGNAWDPVKEEADYVTSSNDDAGVAEAIRKFVL